jgi:hypothetical protein
MRSPGKKPVLLVLSHSTLYSARPLLRRQCTRSVYLFDLATSQCTLIVPQTLAFSSAILLARRRLLSDGDDNDQTPASLARSAVHSPRQHTPLAVVYR